MLVKWNLTVYQNLLQLWLQVLDFKSEIYFGRSLAQGMVEKKYYPRIKRINVRQDGQYGTKETN